MASVRLRTSLLTRNNRLIRGLEFQCNPSKYVKRHISVSSYSGEVFLSTSPTYGKEVMFLNLNRPKLKNAISMGLLREFRECISDAEKNKKLRVLIVCSSIPGSFCAGADLAERKTMTKAQVSDFLQDLRNAFTALENLSIPTIAAIDGPALGGGLELALACDFRIAGHSVTKIGLPETRLGIIPGAGGTQRAARLLGVAKAKELILTGRILTASEALSWGLINGISDSRTTAVDKAVQLAQEMLPSAPLALKAAKDAISTSTSLDLESGLDYERKCYEPLLSTKDRIEALQAFEEKRTPEFTGS
ncbi:enoyl- hydratase [Pyrrhoderma noxium]|uniref:Enoyl-hydratase n=1 Tax=Pyrrhoderma noxium TaxID=2282107 RepID=A0A286UNX9_9AGAM|nr:enoyl- hydratase [Pyrrhoderma noxium]